MELKVDIPSLAGKNIDPETFQRVWNRVMPENTPRNDAVPPPSSIPDTSVPAEPSPAPDEVPSLPPVPDCPSLPPVPDCPAAPDQPSCPECPSCPDCPECPACPECPPQTQCPVCPPQTVCPPPPCCCPPGPSLCPPAPCLVEASQAESRQLEDLMTLAKAGALSGQALVRRAGGGAKTLAALTRDHQLAFRRLSTAYFLITGKRYVPKCAPPCLPTSFALALRQQFVWEQQWEQKNCQAVQAASDPCLKELYLELAQEGALHAGCIRSILEQMA